MTEIHAGEMSGGDARSALERRGVAVRAVPQLMPGTSAFGVAAEDWPVAFGVLAEADWRFSALWAEERSGGLEVSALIERAGDYLSLHCEVADGAALGSIAGVYPGAERLERHAVDLLGLQVTSDGPRRRWTRHAAWGPDQHPLRRDFPIQGDEVQSPALADVEYSFAEIAGSGVYQIPVGPVHAGIIEPGHFRFQAVGETVLNLEERLGYLHRGIEKAAVGRTPDGLARLASRISGDTAVGHAWAACLALERAVEHCVPERGLMMRAVLAETERIINHLWDIAAVCNDVGYAFAYYQFGRLVEGWRRLNTRLFGHRLLMDCVVPGGVAVDLDAEGCEALRVHCTTTRDEVASLWEVLQGNASLHDRLAGTGVLEVAAAARLGTLGFVGRASGQDFDVRRDAPYPPYERFSISVPSVAYGDVSARVRIRHDEIHASLDLLAELLTVLADTHGGAACAPLQSSGAGAGVGIVDGWRGEIVSFVRLSSDGRVERFFPRDPSWFNWLALEELIRDNIVPDFPVCNKSVNATYAGCDL